MERPALAGPRWVRPPGITLLGQVQGSGLTAPAFLVRRPDGQVIQLSHLLHTVVTRIDPRKSPDDLACAVSASYGRTLTVQGLQMLVETKLRPLGLVTDLDEKPEAARLQVLPSSTPLLSLGLRGTLFPERTVLRMADILAPLFNPVVVVVALVALLAMDLRLALGGQVMAALQQVLATPTLLLALFALMTLGAVIHELGHAAGCCYSGGQPGRIGFGVYLLFPAFFTNVTDSYRLDRAGRLRTDLGGLYFNVWCLLMAGGLHLATGNVILLLVVVLMHVEMVQQLVPTVRFDGYFILSDLAGVPDLFARVGPVLTSLLPRRPSDPRLVEMRPTARRVVTVWVLAMVPLLFFGTAWLILNASQILNTTLTAIAAQGDLWLAAWAGRDIVAAALSTISLVLLVVPVAGLVVVTYRLVLSLGNVARRRLGPVLRRSSMDVSTSRHGMPADTPTGAQPLPSPAIALKLGDRPMEDDARDDVALHSYHLHGLTAAEFTDAAVLGNPSPYARSGWRRAIRIGTRGTVSLAPGAAEQHHDDLINRVRAPIEGTRRIVVMSRKGGVGKTTVTVGLGATFATCRGDRVVAVDANPDAGNLSRRIAGDCTRTMTDVLADLNHIQSFSTMRGYTSQCTESRLEVLASDDDARISQALDRPAYREVVSLLDRYYNLIILDTGTGILDSANQGLLAEADQLVLVLRAALDGARAGAQTLDWLEEHGYGQLVANAVVVVNGVTRENDGAASFAREHFKQRCGHVTSIPRDIALEVGARTALSNLAPSTREAFVDLAAAIADNFSRAGRTL
jgi:putative peptide zinc metalloprotease protein